MGILKKSWRKNMKTSIGWRVGSSPQQEASLHEISRVMGLPGKPKGFDGGEVERCFREGKIKETADYCETEVVGTYQVWLRYELFRGALSQDAFGASERDLADFMNCKARNFEAC